MRPLYLLIFVTLLNHSVFAGTRVAASLYAIHLEATPFTVGALMALYALLPMFFAVSMGRWTDRVGARPPMLIGSVAIGSGASLPFLWPGMPALYVASVLIGSGFMMYQVAAQQIVGYIGKPEDRPVNFSLSALGFSISGFVGPMLAGFGIDGIGYTATFALLAGFPLVPIAVLGLDRLRLPQPHAHAAPPDPRRRVADLLRHRHLRPVFITSGLLATAWDMFTFAIPVYGTSIDLSASSIGLVLGAFSVATFVIRGLLPAISRRLSAWPLLAASLAIAAGSFLMFPLLERAALLMAVAFFLGLGLGMSQPMVMSLLHNTVPSGRVGEAVGVRMTLVNASQISIPLLFGALGTALGMLPVFWAAALLLSGGSWYAKRRG
ncbi:MAG TPA: MFS transporter [Burkholderiales bacterium]|nr:MFS transporter [Burkholderiales bacterium]HYA47882.1 MFS transporter [Burkholderiales bacterium]